MKSERANVGVPAIKLSDLFPGPRPFAEGESHLFFGRSQEQNELRSLLQAYRTVLLHAQSGAGKTSLVRAGLLSSLTADGVGWTRCRVSTGHLGSDLRRSANVFVTSLLITGIGVQAAEFPKIEDAFEFLATDAEHVLVLDQFEEFFTRYPDRWADREPFFNQLSDLLDAKPRLRILFVIREEYVSRLEPFAHHLPEEFQIRLYLERLRAAQAKLAISGPFKASDVEFESEKLLDGFVDSLRRQLAKDSAGLATGSQIIEYAGEFARARAPARVCNSLAKGVESSPDRRITKEIINNYGSPERSLTHFYDEAVQNAARQGKVSQAKIRDWFEEAMITPGGTRGSVFRTPRQRGGYPTRLLRRSRWPIRLGPNSAPGAVWYEITHDLFLESIRQSNRKWRTHRPAKKRIAWISAVACLVLVAVITLSFQVIRRADATRKLLADKKAQQEKLEAQLTTKAVFERGTMVAVDTTEAQQEVQRDVAGLLADFLSATSGAAAATTLTAGLGRAWKQDPYQTVQPLIGPSCCIRRDPTAISGLRRPRRCERLDAHCSRT